MTDTYFYDTSDAQLNGMAKHEDGYYLQTRVTGDNPGRLYFRDENRPGSQEETEDFRIRVVVDGENTIRPGDDMQLRCGVSGFPEYDTEVSAGDFMAVYDKKFLWRAQLYVEEGGEDWNNLHPWNAALSVNDWNRDFDDIDNDGNTNEQGNGRQFAIRDWTRYYQEGTRFNDPNTTVTDGIAYSWGASDSVGQFNIELDNQQNCLNISLAGGWTVTTAPNNNWNNYDTQQRINGGTTYYPYRPNYSAKREFVDGDYDGWNHVMQTSGTDCSGFLQRCASYINNPYRLTDFTGEDTWTNPGALRVLEGCGGTFNDSWAVTNNSLIVPGDIIYMSGHVGIVCGVTFTGNTRNVTENNVHIIEATAWGWKTRNDRTWQNLINQPNCQIRRLIVN